MPRGFRNSIVARPQSRKAVPSLSLSDVIVVGNTSDDPFAIDVAFAVGQTEDIADLISMKAFANSEFW